MAMKKGIDAKVTVKISGVQVTMAGIATWAYSGETRELLTERAFGIEYEQQESGIWVGGDIELTGFYRIDTDAAQALLETDFNAATKLYADDIRLFVDGSVYITPDDSITPVSHIIITKFHDVGQDVSGTGTFAASMKVSGRMKEGTV